MGLDMTSKEYVKLWKRFDSSGDGKISYAEVRARPGVLCGAAGERKVWAQRWRSGCTCAGARRMDASRSS